MPGDVCPGQSDLTGPWEDTAEASVTGVKHRCRAQDKRWGHGVGSGIAIAPDACAGATALLGGVPWARMARCDVPERWTVMSPAMDYDVPERWIVTRRPSLLIFGCRVSPSWLVSTLRLSKSARFGVFSKAFGASVVVRELFVAALSARHQSHRRIFPPALPGSGSRGTQEARSQQQR